MWHEARKQEKVVRKVIVNYRKRAERRQEYYEKIKQDPTKFMQVHGRKCKLHIDETGTASDGNNSMMPWQGERTNMIDRFDVRAHLDFIKSVKSSTEVELTTDKEERKCNYERYRILVYNKHRGVSESQHLNKIHINETYPELTLKRQEAEAKKQLLAASKATIGYTYEEDSASSIKRDSPSDDAEEDEEDEDLWSDEEFLNELEDIPPVKELNNAALKDLETFSLEFGLFPGDFTDALNLDQSMQDKMDRAKALDYEKQRMSGKKSRRERRILKDTRLKGRVIGPLSYVLRDPDAEGSESGASSSDSDSSSSSSDRSPRRKSKTENDDGEIQFITSFGDSGEPTSSSDAPPPGSGRTHAPSGSKSRHRSRSPRTTSRDRRWRSRSRSRERKSYKRSYSRRSRSPADRRRRSRSRGRRSSSRDRHRRSRSRDRRSRSPDRRNRSRSKSPKKPFATVKSAGTTQAGAAGQEKKLTPQERLKIKMQRMIKKQMKADRISSAEKRAKAYQEQIDREEELREMSRKMRKRDDDRPQDL